MHQTLVSPGPMVDGKMGVVILWVWYGWNINLLMGVAMVPETVLEELEPMSQYSNI